MTPSIRPGQTYRALDPLDNGRRIRVLAIHGSRVRVMTLDGPPRTRLIWPDQLHPTPTTRTGTPRRTGYALETP